MKKKIFAFVANKFAQAEYTVKYDISFEECIRRQLIYFGGWGKDRFIRLRADSYKGTETAESLEIGSVFEPTTPFLHKFEEEAGVSISAHDTIADIADRIYATRRKAALASVADNIRLWGMTMGELYGKDVLAAPVSIH